DFVLFNRCNDDTNKLALRGSVKVINPKAQVIFELENGEVDNAEDRLPFDFNAEVIKVEEYDFGFWYVDIMNDIDKYVGRKIIITGQAVIPQKKNKGFFILQRKAMTCCAEDISSLQVICRSLKMPVPHNGDWVKVTAVINKSYLEKFDTSLPVLIVKDYCRVDGPEDELLYFY
ncbi:MAG: GTPase, partial [Clostridium sp.]